MEGWRGGGVEGWRGASSIALWTACCIAECVNHLQLLRMSGMVVKAGTLSPFDSLGVVKSRATADPCTCITCASLPHCDLQTAEWSSIHSQAPLPSYGGGG